MYKLTMQTPFRDVLRLWMGRLTVDDSVRADWLRRGRDPFEANVKTTPRGMDPKLHAVLAEAFFPTTDVTPPAISKAAYKVEARRSLLTALTDLTMFLSFGAALTSAALAFAIDLIVGLTVAVIGIVTAAWLHAKGNRLANIAVPWPQGMEPICWALYYPAQMAQEVVRAKLYMQEESGVTIREQWRRLEDRVPRGAHGGRLPGHEERFANLVLYHTDFLPQLLISIDASRRIASAIIARAPAAAQLVEGEFGRQLGWVAGRRGRQLAARESERAYSFLLSEANIFVRLPRTSFSVPDMDATWGSVLNDQAFLALAKEAEALIDVAERIASGQLPDESDTWERPPNRRATVLSATAGIAIAGVGWLLTAKADATLSNAGAALIAMGAVLIPGTLGKLVKESAALGGKASDSKP